MSETSAPSAEQLERLHAFYRDLHEHPELSFAEHRTARCIAERLAGLDAEVTTGVGGTGVVAVLRNGDGPLVMLRADIDALPVAEATGLPYASTATGTGPDGDEVPVMHACGHDMHATCLLGALEQLDARRTDWSGTVLGVFQPAEELAKGAEAMLADGLFDRFGTPEIVLGQHVAPLPAGVLGHASGPTMASSDSARVRIFGRGGHGSRPDTTVDPVVLASSIVLRLQGIVAREVTPTETAVVTVGKLVAGTKDNIIPEQAELGINLRAYSPEVRSQLRAAVERIVRGECEISGAPKEPEIEWTVSAPVTINDPEAAARTVAAFTERFGGERVMPMPTITASEDVGVFGTAASIPTVFWFWGGLDPERVMTAFAQGRFEKDIPSNHSPEFAPVPEPTIVTGVQALTTAALTWLGATR
ncbi:amidohydrolase [Sciscionella sediminilitoris]|uniref:amidohydrolase n=1 Tax=Sciscionella sediminilitoris TaxID=1445613 RepID=UPI0004DECF69|nr:amidohydrolase [Sciscionella sp. SE31]